MSSLVAVQHSVAQHIDEISRHFKDGAKFSLLVRIPGFPDQDFLMTNDDPDEIVAAIERRKAEGKTGETAPVVDEPGFTRSMADRADQVHAEGGDA